MEFLTWFTWLLVILVTAVALVYWHCTKNYGYWESRGAKEARPDYFLKQVVDLSKRPVHDIQVASYKKHGRVFGGFELNKPTFVIADPDLLKLILVKDFHIFTNRRTFPNMDPLVGKVLSVLQGEEWKRVRTIITPSFTTGKMRKMAQLVIDCADVLRDSFLKAAEEGVPIDCKKYFGDFTMNTIASCAFGTKLDTQENENNPFIMHAKKLLNNTPNIFIIFFAVLFPDLTQKLFSKRFFPQTSVNFFVDLSRHIMQKRKETGERGNDFLQLVMDASQGTNEDTEEKDQDESHADGGVTTQLPKKKYRVLSENEAMAQCFLFFLVGYETTASALVFAAYALAINPDCQDRLIKEVDEAWEKNDGKTDYDVVSSMTYLDAVVSETLRLYTIGVIAERVPSEDYELGDTGIVIPKGTVVGIPLYAIHHDSEWYPDPETFDPERFLPENKASRNPYTYLPFGAGPRNCLATRFALMEMKLSLVRVLRYVRFVKAPETKDPLEFEVAKAFLQAKNLVLGIEKRGTAT